MFLLLAFREPQLAAVLAGVPGLWSQEVVLHVLHKLFLLVESLSVDGACLLLQLDVVTVHVIHTLVAQFAALLCAVQNLGTVVDDLLAQFALHFRIVIVKKSEVIPHLPLLVPPSLRDRRLDLARLRFELLDRLGAPPLALPDPDLVLGDQVGAYPCTLRQILQMLKDLFSVSLS